MMRCVSVILALSASWAAVHAAELPAATTPRPAFGLWYSVWYTQKDEHNHWANSHRQPRRGRYASADPALIADHYRQFRELGVDFMIMDDTNGYGVDGGVLNDAIRAWFDFMDAKPVAERIPICACSGGEMRAEGRPGQQRTVDAYYENWALHPSYLHLQGKPLLLLDTDNNYGPGDFEDPRFTTRWVYNGDNFKFMAERHTWGWGCFGLPPALPECMSLWPGHRYSLKITEEGTDVLEEPREGGRRYARSWLHVLKSQPQFVTVADWNNYEEETAIEDSDSWEDPQGYCTPNLYTRITRAYSKMRQRQLVKGEYYRDENQPEVYLYNGRRLVHQSSDPARATVIVLPAGWLDDIRKKLPTATTAPAR